jgi:hypothetical protein
MSDERSYSDPVSHVARLLNSMDSEFRAILVEHQRGEDKSVATDVSPISNLSYTGIVYPEGVAQPDSPETGLVVDGDPPWTKPSTPGETRTVSITISVKEGALNRLAFSLEHFITSDHPDQAFSITIKNVAYLVIQQLVEQGLKAGWYRRGFPAHEI